jgi:DNA-binding beta-propeller fold protein YncE
VAVDGAGRIYVADTGNHRIRRIDPDGTVSTVAGGQRGFADGPPASARFDKPVDLAIGLDGTLFVVDQGNHSVRALRP